MFYYKIDLVDVIEGRGPSPALVMLLVQRLPDTSLTTALARGGREHMGWGEDRHMLASVFDAINAQTRVTGNWKAKPPKLPVYPRPSTRKSGKKATVADLYNRMTRGG